MRLLRRQTDRSKWKACLECTQCTQCKYTYIVEISWTPFTQLYVTVCSVFQYIAFVGSCIFFIGFHWQQIDYTGCWLWEVKGLRVYHLFLAKRLLSGSKFCSIQTSIHMTHSIQEHPSLVWCTCSACKSQRSSEVCKLKIPVHCGPKWMAQGAK